MNKYLVTPVPGQGPGSIIEANDFYVAEGGIIVFTVEGDDHEFGDPEALVALSPYTWAKVEKIIELNPL